VKIIKSVVMGCIIIAVSPYSQWLLQVLCQQYNNQLQQWVTEFLEQRLGSVNIFSVIVSFDTDSYCLGLVILIKINWIA
jgi:hypothetical protein